MFYIGVNKKHRQSTSGEIVVFTNYQRTSFDKTYQVVSELLFCNTV